MTGLPCLHPVKVLITPLVDVNIFQIWAAKILQKWTPFRIGPPSKILAGCATCKEPITFKLPYIIEI